MGLSWDEYLKMYGMSESDTVDQRWQKIVARIDCLSNNQTTKQMIAWRIELQKRKAMIDSVLNKKGSNRH